MTSEPSSAISTISAASTTITPSSTPAKNHPSTSAEMTISIASILVGVFLILILVYGVSRCRRHQKYRRAESKSEDVDVESAAGDSVSKSSQDDIRAICNAPPVTIQTNESLRTDPVSLYNPHSPKDDVEFEKVALHSVRTTPSKPMQSLRPLVIPGKPFIRSNGNGRRSIQRTGSKRFLDPSDLNLEVDDAASVYSEASAYSSISPPPMIPPPVPPMPPMPARFAAPLQSTLPESTDSDVIVISRVREDEIIKSFPLPPASTPLPSLKFSGDEEEQDETEIHNVAKLLHSRQNKLPKSLIRDSTTVSHIERDGSIKPLVLSPAESEAYRPRYHRLKEKKDTRNPFYSSTLNPTDLPNPFETMSLPPGDSSV